MADNLRSGIIKIGLCGGSGSGKGAVGEIFTANGISVIDTDDVYHKLTSQFGDCIRELTSEFGDSIVNENGSLNRAKLSEIVFASGNEDKLKKLNKISHRHVLLKTEKMAASFEKAGQKLVVIDAPVLFESGFNRICDAVVCVIADKELRISRIMERDKISREKAELRISKQLSDEFLIANSDYVIYNNSDIASLKEQTEKIIHEFDVGTNCVRPSIKYRQFHLFAQIFNKNAAKITLYDVVLPQCCPTAVLSHRSEI